MITTSTGAKKLESSDNWREIFPNPGTSAAGAHNASVDAQDRIQAEVAPIINGKRCSLGAASGEYVLLRNSTIAGKTDGAYQATKAIPANTDLDSTYLGSPITGGLVNELNNKITAIPISGTETDVHPLTSGSDYSYTTTKDCWLNIKGNTESTSGNISFQIKINNKFIVTTREAIGTWTNSATSPIYVKKGTTVVASASFPANGGAVLQMWE